jgi:hypothetical protein
MLILPSAALTQIPASSLSHQIASYRGKLFTCVKDCLTAQEAITLCRKNLDAGILSIMVRAPQLIQVWTALN